MKKIFFFLPFFALFLISTSVNSQNTAVILEASKITEELRYLSQDEIAILLDEMNNKKFLKIRTRNCKCCNQSFDVTNGWGYSEGPYNFSHSQSQSEDLMLYYLCKRTGCLNKFFLGTSIKYHSQKCALTCQ